MCARVIACWLQAAWANAHHAVRRVLRLHRVWRAGLALTLLLTVGALDYERYLAGSDQSSEAYPVLALDGYRRLLVFAPHCDDEVLGAGGLIQAALQEGMDVRVAIATAGDGYRRATTAEFHRIFLRPEDFVAMGERRQQESLNALTRLGLDTDAVTFLTYPERGLAALWWDYWESEQPYRSPYSQRKQNLYPRAFHPGAPYSGAALLDDLRTILAMELPDLIVMPHPNDENADHRALSAFVALAVEMERAENPTFRPRLLGYLVHYGFYPQPFGLRPNEGLCPPRQLEAIGEWCQWRLSAEEAAAKDEALKTYHSQQRVLGYFLNSFLRKNELYMEIDDVIELGSIESETFLDVDEVPLTSNDATLPGRDDPVSDSVARRLSSRADITGLHVLRLGHSLWVAVDLRGPVNRTCRYTLYARAFTPGAATTWSGHYGRRSTAGVLALGDTVWYQLDLDALGHPDWLGLAAETHQGLVLDRTAWYLIRLRDGPLD